MTATVLALLAAFTFALSSVLQQRGALDTQAAEDDPNFLKEVIRKPIWIVGGILNLLAVVLQVAALSRGSFVAVQSLCSLSLVFALPLGVRFSGQHVGRRSILGACITLLGIITLVAFGQPQGGSSMPQTGAWLACGLLLMALMLLLTRFARRGRAAAAAALFGTAAGLGYAFQAAVSKEFVVHIGSGLGAILSTWSTYVLVLAWLAGFILEQSSLKTGFLAPGLAACNATILATSVALGVLLFQETLSRGPERLSPALIGLGVAIAGVMLLAYPESRRLEPVAR
jgi:drug/metabolite transporter (DMT)-like permease